MKRIILTGNLLIMISIIYAQGVNENFKTLFSSYTINNSKCVKINHTSGSKIFIQDDAFGTSNSEIEIKYREFITPLDMLVNNIPMTATENGKTYQLESGGMFEIKAFQNEKELKLQKGKKIEVQLARGEGDEKMRKMKAFVLPSKNNDWNTLPNNVNNLSVGNDDDLWGSSPVTMEDEFIDDPFSGEAFGWGDNWCDDCDYEWKKQDSIRKVAFQTMEIDQMGFYNYDYKIQDVNSVPIVANFKINDTPTENTIYVVYDNINTVFYYPPYTWKSDFKLILGENYRMFSFDKDGRIAQLKSIPNLNQVGNINYTFNLILENKAPVSKEELASILKL